MPEVVSVPAYLLVTALPVAYLCNEVVKLTGGACLTGVAPFFVNIPNTGAMQYREKQLFIIPCVG